MAEFQVVAVGQRTGQRFNILKPHRSWIAAEWHRAQCAATYPDETYEIDASYGAQNVDGVRDLGYPQAEVDEIAEWAQNFVARHTATLERTP